MQKSRLCIATACFHSVLMAFFTASRRTFSSLKWSLVLNVECVAVKNEMATSVAGATGLAHQHALPTILAFVSSANASTVKKEK